eukprot:TRINITY_DN20050_c0_g1_i4.p2 TRINITY_DN20050_c0_g1~~TRINITY_DN20050_c0_g1_i4.p2  ORF type:complete len:302 (+),score=37.94 TRINITY_DN20050_c0_g1_i4:140-1045(+)
MRRPRAAALVCAAVAAAAAALSSGHARIPQRSGARGPPRRPALHARSRSPRAAPAAPRLVLRATFPTRAVAGMAAISLRCPGEALVVAPNFYGPAAVFRFRPPPAGAAAGAPQHLSPSQTLPTRSAHGVGLLRSGGALWAAVPHYGGASSTVFSAAEGGGSSGCLDEDAPRFRMRHRLRSYRAVAALPFEVNGSVLVAISNYYNASTQVWRVAGGPTRHPELVAHLGLHAAAPLAVCGDRGLLCAAPGGRVGAVLHAHTGFHGDGAPDAAARRRLPRARGQGRRLRSRRAAGCSQRLPRSL